MKIGKKLLVLSLSCLMIMSQFNRVHASEELTGRNLKQRSLEVVENMPNISSHYKILDWAKRGKDLNDFVFDYTATNFDKKTEFSVKEGRTFSTIYRDDKYGGYMIPAFYGEDRPLRSTEKHDGEDDQESISVTSALIVASLLGINMNKELPKELKGKTTIEGGYEINTYLDNALKYFWNGDKGNVFTNVPNGSESKLQNMENVSNAYGDFWYLLIANQNFYRLAYLNPDWKPEEVLKLQETVADRMIDMVDVLKQKYPDDLFNIQCFDFENMEAAKGWHQPDAAVGTGCILYYSGSVSRVEDKGITIEK